MTTRTVTGTIKHADGTAWQTGAVQFRVMEPFTSGTDTYPTETHTETTDSNGAFSTALGVPASGSAHYYVVLPDESGHELYLSSGDAVDLSTLLITTAADADAVEALLTVAKRITSTNVTGTYTMLTSDEYIRASGTFTVTLLAATATGRVITIKNIGTGTITVAPAGTDTIDGATTWTLIPLASVTLIDASAGRWDA